MVLLVIAAVIIVAVVNRGPAGRGTSPPGASSLAAEEVVRAVAVEWMTSNVGRDVSVACDTVTCADLAQHGFPAGNLNVLHAVAQDPYGSGLVMATADIRSQFGSKLATVYAPEVLASFGSGTGRIDIRVIAPDGPAAFRTALRADAQDRRTSGTELLGNRNIAVSGTPRQDIATGQVDLRLLTTLAFLAGQRAVDIVAFGAQAPGASPSVPLRLAYLAETDASAHLPGSAYVQALTSTLKSEQPPYVPLTISSVRLPDGQAALRIEFAAPSPLGLPRS